MFPWLQLELHTSTYSLNKFCMFLTGLMHWGKAWHVKWATIIKPCIHYYVCISVSVSIRVGVVVTLAFVYGFKSI